MTESIRQASALVAKAQAMTQELRRRDPKDHLLVYAENQLKTMSEILQQGRVPTSDEKKAINVGLMAVRELEGGPLDNYAGALEEASGAFHSL
jgi:hypothetical protein